MDCYVVTLVCPMNDLVLAVVDNLDDANRIAAEHEPGNIPEDIQDAYGYYGSQVIGVDVVRVVGGRPVSVEMEREF